MKSARYLLMALLLGMSSLWVRADETVTVSSTGTDISENLDLRAVATLFGEVSNLEEFEQQLNSEERHISNLDLNGDGVVDYLRVVEIESQGKHLIIIQAVLAKDIYQDVASILVEKDPTTAQVNVQVVGDVWLYGENYIIEPVYIYRPVIYDWFWGAAWVCWVSPWYWDYWPGYWHYGWAPWAYHTYCHHIHHYHHEHPRCTYHYSHTPRPAGEEIRHIAATSGTSRRDVASRAPERSFTARNTGMTNARQITSRRTAEGTSGRTVAGAEGRTVAGTASARTVGTTATTRTGNTFGSTYQRSAGGATGTGTRAGTTGTGTRTGTTAAGTRTATTSTRSAGTTATTRSTGTTATSTRSYTPAQSTTRSTGTSGTTATGTRTATTSTRVAGTTGTTRSTSSYTPSRTTTSTSTTRSTGSYGGGTTRSTGSYGGGSSMPRGGGGGGSSRGGTVRR